jgi:DNA-binding transcriptional LysR family regulator
MLNETDLSRADLNLLLLFETVMQERHVGRAAEKLNLSASAVSHGLGRLRLMLNDPLFVRSPKGVVPTERANMLAPQIAETLTAVRRIVASAAPFDPGTSRRHLMIGAPDAVAPEMLPRLLSKIRTSAPNISIGVRNLLPVQMAWTSAFTDLDCRAIDLAIMPFTGLPEAPDAPARFVTRMLYDEEFVVTMREGHPYAKAPSLKHYLAMHHVLVSSTGDREGFVDMLLAEQRLSRHVALTVPNFMAALAVIAETNLLAALPGRFAAAYAKRFDAVIKPLPIPQRKSRLHIVVPKAAMMDEGLAWLVGLIEDMSACTRLI